MSRNPKPPQDGNAGDVAGMIAAVEAPVAPYVKSSTAHPPVPDRTRIPDIGPCDPSSMPARSEANTPRSTEELRRGIDLGTPTGADGGPSAAYGSLSYRERQARARRRH